MNFCVIGAGAWGTGVAIHLANNGHSTTLVPRRYEHALKLASKDLTLTIYQTLSFR